MSTKVNPPYVHFELMSDKAESQIGAKPFVIILKADYQTNGTDKIVTDSLEHAAEVLNKTADKLPAQFPFVAYPEDTGFGGVNRGDSWVYLSMRNIPAEVENIKTWMLKVATDFSAQKGIAIKQMKVDATQNTATIYKIAWRSTDISKI